MIKDAFTKIEQAEAASILEDVNPFFQGGPFDADTVTILAQDIPFYPKRRFLDIADYEANPARRRFVVYKPREVTVLNWTNDPIYALNEKVPIRLNDSTVMDYVQFFFAYVRGRHGRFLICETVDDVRWRDEPPPAARKAVGQMITPIQVKSRDKDGGYILSACMVFKDSLFRTTVNVRSTGLVSLSDEELLVEDMPVLDDTFGQ